jgi:hypothetical protein
MSNTIFRDVLPNLYKIAASLARHANTGH